MRRLLPTFAAALFALGLGVSATRHVVAEPAAAPLVAGEHAKVSMAAFVGPRRALLGGIPSWVLRPGGNPASVDLNFAQGLYYQANAPGCRSALACITTSRASVGTNLLPVSPNGFAFTTFPANIPRFSPSFGSYNGGLLVYQSVENFLLSSGAPATQTTASLAAGTYTLWINGSGTATPSAGTATGCTGFAAASQGVVDTFACTGAGTITVTVSGSLNEFQLDNTPFGGAYCPTTSSVQTCAADMIALTTFPGAYPAYWLYASGTPAAPTSFATNQRLLTIGSSGATPVNISLIYRAASSGQGAVANGGTGGTTSSWAFNGALNVNPVLSQGSFLKSALAVTGASAMSQLDIGVRPDGALQFNGTIARIAYGQGTTLPSTVGTGP